MSLSVGLPSLRGAKAAKDNRDEGQADVEERNADDGSEEQTDRTIELQSGVVLRGAGRWQQTVVRRHPPAPREDNLRHQQVTTLIEGQGIGTSGEHFRDDTGFGHFPPPRS